MTVCVCLALDTLQLSTFHSLVCKATQAPHSCRYIYSSAYTHMSDVFLSIRQTTMRRKAVREASQKTSAAFLTRLSFLAPPQPGLQVIRASHLAVPLVSAQLFQDLIEVSTLAFIAPHICGIILINSSFPVPKKHSSFSPNSPTLLGLDLDLNESISGLAVKD